MQRPAPTAAIWPGLLPLLAACGGGTTAPVRPPPGIAPELVFVRASLARAHDDVEIVTATTRGLDARRRGSRSGRETGVRVHPDGKRIAFARETRRARSESREIFVSSWDGSSAEQRLTADRWLDDGPCWSPDGETIAFSSDRGGHRQLWRIAAGGGNPEPLTSSAGRDRDPDWRGDRIVFSRLDTTARPPRARLYTMTPTGAGQPPPTDGGRGPGGRETPAGDFEPALAPDGKTAVFSRVLEPGRRVLMKVDLATGATEPLTDGSGEERWPRWSPHGDRLFVASSRPAAGRPGLRLHQILPDGGGLLLLFPDERYEYPGIDVLPGLAPRPATESERRDADLDAAELDIPFGRQTLGRRRSIRVADDKDVLGIATTMFKGRDIAALWMRMPLPASRPTEVAEIHVEVRAALSRVDPESYLRLALHNPVARRFDTITEQIPGDTGLRTLRFSIGSHAHLDRDRNVRLEVIGDLSGGARAELFVDLVRISVVLRQGTTPR